MSNTREVVEGRQIQGVAEEIAYKLTVTPWGSDPTGVAVKAYDVDQNYLDVSTTVLSGSASVLDDDITTPVVKSLVQGHVYVVTVKFTVGGNILEAFFEVQAER